MILLTNTLYLKKLGRTRTLLWYEVATGTAALTIGAATTEAW